MLTINQTLLDKGILTPTGEIIKDKINLISGTVTQPFVETLWVTTNGDMDTINRMTDIFTQLFSDGKQDQLMDVLRLLYGVLGLQFPYDVELLADHPEARQYFLFSFLLDFDDVMQDYMMDFSDYSIST